jgi:hypothetical protein
MVALRLNDGQPFLLRAPEARALATALGSEADAIIQFQADNQEQ